MRDHRDQQVVSTAIDDGPRHRFHSNQNVGGRTELDPVQDEIDEAKRLLVAAHAEELTAQEEVAEAARRAGEAMEENAKLKSLIEAILDSADR